MTAGSDVIFTGVCVSSQSRWDAQNRVIVTDSVFRVEQYIKGTGPSTVLLTNPGGVLPQFNLAMSASGVPDFHVGEEVLLFLTRPPRGNAALYGLGRGKQTIERERNGAPKIQGTRLDLVINQINRALRDQKTNK
jgi:hypothetical protein